jgi:hypothetical protein
MPGVGTRWGVSGDLVGSQWGVIFRDRDVLLFQFHENEMGKSLITFNFVLKQLLSVQIVDILVQISFCARLFIRTHAAFFC